tara:strand:- start:746 stop:1855 length:1110 start_codon:yes stop_codon:yes gene_type:complete
MSDNIDILAIDQKIRLGFLEEFEKIPFYTEKLKELSQTIDNLDTQNQVKFHKNLQYSYDSLNKYLDKLNKQTEYNLYIVQTLPIIENYKKILKTPVKVSFLGKEVKNDTKKNKLIDEFLKISVNYTDDTLVNNNNNKNSSDTIQCPNCNNKKDFDNIDKNIYVCQYCFAQQLVLKHISSYNDIDRINISSKYMYDRKIHFRDCIKQYQGKQNSTIVSKIFDSLEEQFEKHHLLVGDKETTSREERFKNVTKNHVLLFLKELGYSNHYENVHLIHFSFTNIKPDDISHLEDQLLDDFDALTDLYDKKFKHINRKNFINTQYVLYQLLRRHKHQCNKDEFIILKTIDRKFFHDEICKELFEELGWNHTPFY